MIRVKIAGEEVLSNKDFTITEELLKTSSTILDNVYPKTWEETHDYVNNFYFPKDYSSCTIENVEAITPITGTRVSGKNLSINYDDTLSWDLEQLKGNTTQQTYTGKNLLKNTNANSGDNNYWQNYSTFDQTTGTLTRSTTSTSEATINHRYNLKNNTTYTISCLAKSNGYVSSFQIYAISSNFSKIYNTPHINITTSYTKQSFTFTTDSSTDYTNSFIRFDNDGSTTSGTTATLTITDVMLVEGTNTDFEPYLGGTPSPNPDYPQPVNNVTGRQEIDVVGKNLFDKDNANVLNAYMYYNSGRIVSDNTGRTVWIKIKPNTTYTVSKMATARFMIGTFSQQPNYNVTPTNYRGNNTATSISITSGANDTYLSAWIYNSSYDTSTPEQIMATLQIEEGNQVTTYEPYIEKQYEINLGKNLFDKDNANTLMAYINGSGKITQDTELGVLYIPCKPNTKYALQKSLQNPTSNNRFRVGCCASKPAINTQLSKHNNLPNGTTETTMIFETDSTANYLVFNYAGGSTSSIAEVLENIQIEVGNQATSYSPYKTPIELCKIGNYQDYLYKNNNKWYLHKEIEKNIFVGTENWERWSASSGKYRFALDTSSNIVKPPNNSTLGNAICNNYTLITGNQTGSNVLGFGILASGYTAFYNNDIQALEDWKTWLNSHNVTVYYALNTPIDTEITDEELIEQLNSVELLNGINNINTISPNENGELQIYYNYRNAGEDINLIFAGLVKNSGSISLRPTDPKYCSLQILDYKTLLSEGQTLDYVINNKTIKEAIQMVINSVTSYGFIEGNIDINAANDVIGAYSTLNKTPYDVFQYLADISQSKWFTRVVDEKTIAIDFYDPDKLPKADDIEYTEQYFKDNKIIDINYSFSGSDYRNKQTILSEKVYGNVAINDIITCNGYEQTFTTSQTIGTVSSIKVNNVEKTFATNTEKGLGIVADFYYSPNGNSFESNDLYDAGDKIIISYYPIVKGRRVISNDDEISRINQQINRNGVISRYEERNDIVDGDELSKVAEAYIKYKGTAEIKLNVLTENKDLFNIGQQVYFDMPNVEDLATDYMVKKKQIEIIQTGEYKNVFYTYELTSNFNSETDINFFDNQRRKAEGNISEDQFITRNVDINNSTNIIFDNLQVIEVQTTDNNTLNCALNSPFIN